MKTLLEDVKHSFYSEAKNQSFMFIKFFFYLEHFH